MNIGYLGKTPLGNLYRCKYSGRVAIEKWMKFVSPVLPQCPTAEPVHKTLDQELIKAKRKESIDAFNEMDANCNTCKHFVRLKADNAKGSNSASNFVYGNCSNNGQIELIPYKRDGYQIMVHVADYLGMPCWEKR
jgi:hypothetical protein